MESKQPLLEVQELVTHFYTDDGVVKAVDGVDLKVFPGEIIGLVGESGCGKSVTSFSIIGLVDPPGKIIGGKILFEGKDLLKLSDDQMQEVRGNQISMIFQQPQSCLNPVFTVGSQIVEVFEIHEKVSKKEAWRKSIDLLRIVGIPDPEKKAKAYPHELSGGQAQRVMIAMALALNPKLLIADEPTTALDVTIQAQILLLLADLRTKFNTSIILITHDLGVISEMADRVAVMYAGKVVEETSVNSLFKNPMHPYTVGLIASVPVLGQIKESLSTIPGNVPNLIGLPPGCRFKTRCEMRQKYGLEICEQREPNLISIKNDSHKIRCWLYESSDVHKAPLSED